MVLGEVPKRPFLAPCLTKLMGREMCSCGDVSGAANGAGKTQARTCANTLQRRSWRSEREKSYRRPFSSQNAVRRVVQKTGGRRHASTFDVRNYALAVARCSFLQIIPAGFASAGMFMIIFIIIIIVIIIIIKDLKAPL